MDDLRTCGNGHVFPARESTCPECDSVASRPATRREIEQADPALRGSSAGAAPATPDKPSDSLAGYLIAGVSVSIFSALIFFVGVDSGSFAALAFAYLVGLVGLGLLLVGIIGVGVREGMEAHLARFGRRDL